MACPRARSTIWSGRWAWTRGSPSRRSAASAASSTAGSRRSGRGRGSRQFPYVFCDASYVKARVLTGAGWQRCRVHFVGATCSPARARSTARWSPRPSARSSPNPTPPPPARNCTPSSTPSPGSPPTSPPGLPTPNPTCWPTPRWPGAHSRRMVDQPARARQQRDQTPITSWGSSPTTRPSSPRRAVLLECQPLNVEGPRSPKGSSRSRTASRKPASAARWAKA